MFKHIAQRVMEVLDKPPVGTRDTTRRNPSDLHQQWAESSSIDFLSYIHSRLLTAKHAFLMGTGLNIIHNDALRKQLLQLYAEDLTKTLEIYLANPLSSTVQTRLIEEELGMIKPPVGKQGLLNRISGIVGEWKKLGSPENVRIRLFTHYPTFALIVLDHSHYFFYPYGLSTLGNFSPIIYFRREREADDSAIRFFDQQMRLVSERAYPAELLLKEPKQNHKYLQELHPFALYIIPRENTPLYEIGSQVLGYDIRRTRNIGNCPWPNYVGIANNYGFHVTICDVLYFASPTEIDYVVEEVRFILKEFHSFFLTNCVSRAAFQMSIACR